MQVAYEISFINGAWDWGSNGVWSYYRFSYSGFITKSEGHYDGICCRCNVGSGDYGSFVTGSTVDR